MTRGSWFRLLAFLRPWRWLFLASLALGVTAAAFEAFSLLLLIPFLRSLFDMGPLIPDGGRNAAERFLEGIAGGWFDGVDGLAALRAVCLVVLAAVVVKNICIVGSRALSIRVQELLARDLRNTVHGHVQRLPLSYFRREKVGQVIARVMTDTGEAKPVVTDALAVAVRQFGTLVAYGAALFALSWPLALVALPLVPLVVISLRPLARRLRRGFRRTHEDHGELIAALQEAVSAVRRLKSRGAEGFEDGRFRTLSNAFTRRRIVAVTTRHLAAPVSDVLATAIALGLVWIGAAMVLGGGVLGGGVLGPEQFVAFVTIAVRAIPPLKGLAQYPAAAEQGLAAADRCFELLDEPPEPPGGDREAPRLESSIRFENVSFSYDPERSPASPLSKPEPLLSGINLTVPKGAVVAIAGSSGSGKTTLVELLPRFIDPERGRILLDEVDVRDFSLASWRRQVGFVSHGMQLLNDSVMGNIAYGSTTSTREEIVLAARAAGAHDFIEALPQGYQTRLGDRGTGLSSGQRKRILIASALLGDPPILILDEVLSALDAQTELELRRDGGLFRGRTVILVTHRLSTARGADQVFVLEDGCLAEAGGHDHLMASDGPYKRLFSDQLEAGTG